MKLILILSVFLVMSLTNVSAQENSGWTLEGLSSGYSYQLYTPKNLGENPGVVLLLHGCTQSAQQSLTQTKLAAEADRKGFYVFAPQQSNSSNPWGCWNWSDATNQSRNSGGDSVYILTNLERIIQEKKIDRSKVFLAGFSSGAAMGMNLSNCFPDIFHGAMIHSGLEFSAASSTSEAFQVMRSGPSRAVEQTAKMALDCAGTYARPIRTIIVHGSSDTTVAPVNFQRINKQLEWMNEALVKAAGGKGEITRSETSVAGAKLATKLVEVKFDGQVLQQSYLVEGMKHAWSGGDSSVQFSEPRGIAVSTIFADTFFPN